MSEEEQCLDAAAASGVVFDEAFELQDMIMSAGSWNRMGRTKRIKLYSPLPARPPTVISGHLTRLLSRGAEQAPR
jgi:hypothetical protein